MDKDKRKLTEKELKRKNDFEKLSSEMQQKGYKMKNVVINTQKAKATPHKPCVQRKKVW